MADQTPIERREAGDILSLPPIDNKTKECDLQKFIRRGLDCLDNWSVIRINPAINEANPGWLHPIHTESRKSSYPVPTCEICASTLREKAGIPDNTPASRRLASWEMILFNHKQREIFVCSECAARSDFYERILELAPKEWEGLFASDGRDVFGFVNAIMAGSQLDSRARIHTIDYKPDNSLLKVVTVADSDRRRYGLPLGDRKVCQEINWPIETLKLIDGHELEQQPQVNMNIRSGHQHVSPLASLAESLLLDLVYLERVDSLLQAKKQVIFYGPPGTGKTFVAMQLANHYAGDNGDVRLVQFHPSYAYEDFIEGFRPRQDEGNVGFHLVDGPLKKLAKQATDNPDATFVLVIDEINRGNVAKVLGELYFLLEYRDEEINLQYSSEAFSLPENLWIIGTMNTADRSIALIDAALRRRFYFVPFMPDESPVEGLLRRWLGRNKPELTWVADVVDKANRELGDRHMAIGPSYFMKPDLDERWVGLIWEHSILPYIAEQFFGEESRLDDFRLDRLRGLNTPVVVDSDAPADSE